MTITCAIIDDEPGSRTIKKLCGEDPLPPTHRILR